MKQQKKNAEEVVYTSLKKRLAEIGMPIPGTIHALYARCGSPTCPCATDDNKRHGPYYRWHYRIDRRSFAQKITDENVHLFENWIKNREKIYALVDDMMAVGINAARNKMGPGSAGIKSKKNRKSMRGK